MEDGISGDILTIITGAGRGSMSRDSPMEIAELDTDYSDLSIIIIVIIIIPLKDKKNYPQNKTCRKDPIIFQFYDE